MFALWCDSFWKKMYWRLASLFWHHKRDVLSCFPLFYLCSIGLQIQILEELNNSLKYPSLNITAQSWMHSGTATITFASSLQKGAKAKQQTFRFQTPQNEFLIASTVFEFYYYSNNYTMLQQYYLAVSLKHKYFKI